MRKNFEIIEQYWMGLCDKAEVRSCHDEALPSRKDIDPISLPRSLLPYIMLIDVTGNEDLKIRLAGTAYFDAYGFEITGRKIADIENTDPRLQSHFKQWLQNPKPERFEWVDTITSDVMVLRYWLNLPLASDGKTVDGILVLTEFYNEIIRTPLQKVEHQLWRSSDRRERRILAG